MLGLGVILGVLGLGGFLYSRHVIAGIAGSPRGIWSSAAHYFGYSTQARQELEMWSFINNVSIIVAVAGGLFLLIGLVSMATKQKTAAAHTPPQYTNVQHTPVQRPKPGEMPQSPDSGETVKHTLTKICGQCGAKISGSGKFCSECGGAVKVCKQCGETLLSEADFCGNCGTPVPKTQ